MFIIMVISGWWESRNSPEFLSPVGMEFDCQFPDASPLDYPQVDFCPTVPFSQNSLELAVTKLQLSPEDCYWLYWPFSTATYHSGTISYFTWFQSAQASYIYRPGWWFGTFFIFPYIGNNHPNWLIFFRGVQTTNQLYIYIYILYIHISTYAHAGICILWWVSWKL